MRHASITLSRKPKPAVSRPLRFAGITYSSARMRCTPGSRPRTERRHAFLQDKHQVVGCSAGKIAENRQQADLAEVPDKIDALKAHYRNTGG